MAELERTYIVPLRKQVNKSPRYKRAKKAVNTVRAFLEKHMKSQTVKLGEILNLTLWERGMRNPPGKIKVTAVKDDKGVVRVELFGHKYVEKKLQEKKVEKSKLEQLKEKIVGKEGEKAAQEEVKKDVLQHQHVEEHKSHGHTPSDHNKELKNAQEKERKVTTGTIQGGHRDKK